MWQVVLLTCNLVVLVPKVEYRDCRHSIEATFEEEFECRKFAELLSRSEHWNEKRICEKDGWR